MKRLMLFLQCILDELGMRCGTSTARDWKTITSRVEHEGLSFLTITLSDLGKDIEKCLDQGHVGHDQFLGFAKAGSLPRIFGGFFDLVFDRASGRLLDSPSIDAIQALRQLTLMFAKIGLESSDARKAAAIARYVECEQEVRASDALLDESRKDSFSRIGRLLWANVLQAVDEDIYYLRLIPRHGPGSTADRLKGNLKWMQHEWTQRLEREFPSGTYLFSNPIVSEETMAAVDFLEPGAEKPVKVITVPKTLKTPRIIAMEPTCMQYMQQGILASFVKALGANDSALSLIGSSSQIPNQELARVGSLEGNLATLDLSEASDRVSNQHVRLLLANHPNLFHGVDACRSRKADVPGYGVLRLAKFASMGSALAFPFEAMVFCTVIFVGIERQLSRPLTKKDINSFLGQVRVYGDDIVVPVEFVHSVMAELEAFGFRVNANKSFWTGKFRESCGKEYYDGDDVSIVRLRTEFPTSREHVAEIVSLVGTRNQLYKAGLWKTARFLDDYLGSLIPFPVVAETSPVLGRHSFLGYETQKMCPDTHRPLVRGMVVKAKSPVSRLDDRAALLKVLTLLEMRIDPMPGADSEHLERAGRSSDVRIIRKWAPSA